jgi:hypothetical protein
VQLGMSALGQKRTVHLLFDHLVDATSIRCTVRILAVFNLTMSRTRLA